VSNIDVDQIKQEIRARADKIVAAKRPSYVNGSSNPLANIDRVADMLNLRPAQVALVYCAKHFLSVATIASGGSDGGEAWLERLADIENYLSLIGGCLRRSDEAEPEVPEKWQRPSNLPTPRPIEPRKPILMAVNDESSKAAESFWPDTLQRDITQAVQVKKQP